MAKSKVTFEFSDGFWQEVVEAIAVKYNWPQMVDNQSFNHVQPEGAGNPRVVPNPESKEDHAKRKLIEQIASIWEEHEKQSQFTAQKNMIDAAIDLKRGQIVNNSSVVVQL